MSESEPPNEATDPVCGEVFPPELATFGSEHEGHSVWFCSIKCKQDFDADPSRFDLDPEP